MLHLNSLTSVTYGNILRDLPFYTVPPESFLRVLVHFLAARMYKIGCFMSFLDDQLLNRFDIRNTQPIFEPYYAFRVFSKVFAFPIQDQLSDLIDLLIIFCPSFVSRSRLGSS
jgi:hypothetical protein